MQSIEKYNSHRTPIATAAEDIKRGDLLQWQTTVVKARMTEEEKINQQIIENGKAIDIKCPYCCLSQRIVIIPNKPTVIKCMTFMKGCERPFLVELIDKPMVKISVIDWQVNG